MKPKDNTIDELIPIVYPKSYSEYDVQFLLCSELKDFGIDFRTEVKLESRFGIRGARFDVVVFKDKVAIAIIEVKRKNNGKAPSQQDYYHRLTGLPVLVCGGMQGVASTVRAILKLIE